MRGLHAIAPELAEEILKAYVATRLLPDGRYIGVARLMFHWTLHVDIHDSGYENRYCYGALDSALKAMADWDGQGDPDGWHRNPSSGRRRDVQTGRIWFEP